MRVLITGAGGQVGRELLATAPAGIEPIGADRAALDITNAQEVRKRVAELKPALIINAAAYTAVDKAETEREPAFRANRDGAAHLAEAARSCRARLIHVSTDYVFDGAKGTPYTPEDAPNPLNVYGASKLAGEKAVQDILRNQGLVVRTSWVYAEHGQNFVRTMLRLLRERREVRVVSDQVSSPTHAASLAEFLWRLAARPDLSGTYHWTDSGVASWYDFACAIRECAAAADSRTSLARVTPIASADFPTAAQRPKYSVLDKSKAWAEFGAGRHWRDRLAALLPAERDVKLGAAG